MIRNCVQKWLFRNWVQKWLFRNWVQKWLFRKHWKLQVCKFSFQPAPPWQFWLWAVKLRVTTGSPGLLNTNLNGFRREDRLYCCVLKKFLSRTLLNHHNTCTMKVKGCNIKGHLKQFLLNFIKTTLDTKDTLLLTVHTLLNFSYGNQDFLFLINKIPKCHSSLSYKKMIP